MLRGPITRNAGREGPEVRPDFDRSVRAEPAADDEEGPRRSSWCSVLLFAFYSWKRTAVQRGGGPLERHRQAQVLPSFRPAIHWQRRKPTDTGAMKSKATITASSVPTAIIAQFEPT